MPGAALGDVVCGWPPELDLLSGVQKASCIEHRRITGSEGRTGSWKMGTGDNFPGKSFQGGRIVGGNWVSE